jgi:acyl carrier protein
VTDVDETLRTLEKLWASVLDVSTVAPGDNFFELGGHSLTAALLALQVYDRFGVEVLLHELLQAPTLREMRDLVDERLLVASGGEAERIVDDVAALSDDEVRRLLDEL